MIKGCQRKVIVVKGEEENMFEYAYFILKNNLKYDRLGEVDMVSEANRIIEESENMREAKIKSKDKSKEKNSKKIIIPFSVGAAVGSAAGLLWLFL